MPRVLHHGPNRVTVRWRECACRTWTAAHEATLRCAVDDGKWIGLDPEIYYARLMRYMGR